MSQRDVLAYPLEAMDGHSVKVPPPAVSAQDFADWLDAQGFNPSRDMPVEQFNVLYERYLLDREAT